MDFIHDFAQKCMNKDEVLAKLAEKAAEYLDNDSNASLIKQGMMLEFISKKYLIATSQLNNVKSNYSDPTLDDMLFFLSRISVIPKSSEAYLLCDQIRKNRNDAVHNFKESSDDARQTFPKLIRLCDDLLFRSSRINNAQTATTWTNPSLRQRADSGNYFNEPESAYCVSESAPSYNAKSSFVMAFEECMRDFNL